MVTTRMSLLRQVARDRQRHADDAALGRRVGGLTDLAVERRDRRGVDDDATLSSPIGSVLAIRSAASRSTLKVPTKLMPDHLRNAVQRERAVLGQRLNGIADARTVDVDPQRAQRLGHIQRGSRRRPRR